jgi:hypothetical protein
MFQVGRQQRAHELSDWVVESIQEIVSKMNKAKRAYFLIVMHIDERRQFSGDKVRQDVCHWLSPPDPWKTYNTACESRYGGTGTWWIRSETTQNEFLLTQVPSLPYIPKQYYQ